MYRIFFIVFLIGTSESNAQENFTGYYEPYLQLEYDHGETYSHEFTVENRIYWYDDKGFEVNVKQLDLAHFSSLKLYDKNALALGVQYRFEEKFSCNEENELRFTEEYTYTTKTGITEFEHRFRAEQRIAPSLTSHRFRYGFGISRPLKGAKIYSGETYLLGNLETLWTVAQTMEPKYEQRISGGLGGILTDFTEFEIVAEYRLGNFTRNPGHELFFVTGLKFIL